MILLFHVGRILKDEQTLEGQGITHESTVLVLELPAVQGVNEKELEVNSVREDALKAASAKASLIEVTDQRGSALPLSTDEKKAMIVAMALHDRGTISLRRGDFAFALLFFTEADREFQ